MCIGSLARGIFGHVVRASHMCCCDMSPAACALRKLFIESLWQLSVKIHIKLIFSLCLC